MCLVELCCELSGREAEPAVSGGGSELGFVGRSRLNDDLLPVLIMCRLAAVSHEPFILRCENKGGHE